MLTVLNLVIASSALLLIVCAVFVFLSIKSFRKLKTVEGQLDVLHKRLASNDVLQGGLKSAASDRATLAAGVSKTAVDQSVETRKFLEQIQQCLRAEHHEVKSHMARYGAVLESQERLIKTVAELTEEVSGGRRHR